MGIKRKFVYLVITTALAAAGSTLTGLLFYQGAIFRVSDITFQFVSFGIVGGLVFSTFRFLSKPQSAVVLILLLLVDVLLQRSNIWRFMLRDLLYYFGIVSSLFVFARYYFDRVGGVFGGRSIVLASLTALSYIVAAIVIYVLFAGVSGDLELDLSRMVLFNISQGFLLGLGAGAGIETAEYLSKRAGIP